MMEGPTNGAVAPTLKVLMTADTLGGVWTYALELIRALAPLNIEVVLATMGRRMSDDQRRQAVRLPNLTVHESEYRLEWMSDAWNDVDAAGDWLMRLQQESGADVMHLNGYAHASWPWSVPVYVVAHSCVMSWWQAVHGTAAPAVWDEYRRRVSEGLAAATEIVSPSRAMAECLRRHYGQVGAFDAAERPIQVIPNGRSPDNFRAGPKHPFVFAAGRLWDQAKNLSVLDEAAAGLPWPVWLAGPIEHPELNAAFPARHARLLGVTPNDVMRHWFSQADIYALPARYEPFGLSVLEAALSGCALLLGDIESLRENWDGAAHFVNPEDADAVRAGLKSLIKTPRLRRDLAQRAHQRAMEFTPQRMAHAYAALYRGEHPHPSPAITSGSAATVDH